MWRAVRSTLSVACALGILSGVVGCGGGTSGAPPEAYCQLFQQDWSTLEQATAEANTAWTNAQPFGFTAPDLAQISQQLIADQNLFDSAAGMAADLAKIAPTKLYGQPGMTEDAQKSFQELSAGLTAAGQGSTDLDDLAAAAGPDLDTGGTGCNFEMNGAPDGTVATIMWQP